MFLIDSLCRLRNVGLCQCETAKNEKSFDLQQYRLRYTPDAGLEEGAFTEIPSLIQTITVCFLTMHISLQQSKKRKHVQSKYVFSSLQTWVQEIGRAHV